MHGGHFSLIRLFTQFAMLGAEWVMWVLILLSVASVAVMLERARYYNSLSDDLDKLAEDVRALLRKGDRDGARERLKKSPSPAAVVALAGLDESEYGMRAAEEAMAGAVARVRITLERYLAFLGTMGNNAPFVGLFGTVIGIIQAFDKLRENEQAAREAARRAAQGAGAAAATFDTGAVMGTLAEALVATAIGLLVAIPAVAAFNYFQRRVKAILASSETLTHVIIGSMAETTARRESMVPAAREKEPAESRKESKEPAVSKDKKESRPSKSEGEGKN
jgi:biopolymer transport protein ExbB